MADWCQGHCWHLGRTTVCAVAFALAAFFYWYHKTRSQDAAEKAKAVKVAEEDDGIEQAGQGRSFYS